MKLNYKSFRYMMLLEGMPEGYNEQVPPGTLKLTEYLKLLPEELKADASAILASIGNYVTTRIDYAMSVYNSINVTNRREFASIVTKNTLI